VLIVGPEAATPVLATLLNAGEDPVVVGELTKASAPEA